MKRRMRNRTYGVVRGGQGQPNRLLDKSIALIAKYILQDIFVDPSITMRDITH